MNCYQATAKNNNQSRYFAKKFAKTNDLQKITYTIFDNHIDGLSNKSRALLSFVISLVKIGYNGINAPIDAINRAMSRSTGYHCSERSFYRSLSELESKAFLRRSKFRVGDDRFGTVISFNLDAFTYWTRTRKTNVTPINTRCDITSHLPKRQKDEVRKTNIHVNSRNNSIYNKPRARAGKSYSRWIHPIVFTIGLLLKGNERRFAVSRATIEIEMGGDVEGHSGVPWETWPRWQEMAKDARENIAKREIIPRLLDKSTLRSQTNDLASLGFGSSPATNPEPGGLLSFPDLPPKTQSPPPKPTMTPNQIAAAIASFSSKAEKEEQLCKKNRNAKEKISLDNDDLKILTEARARALSRSI